MLPELSKEEEERLLAIRDKYRIEPERFRNGYVFATLIEEGQTRVEAYMIAFDVNRVKATQSATRLYGAGWIQCILGEIELDQSIQAKEDLETIREEMRHILISDGFTAQEKTNASKVLADISKKKVKVEDLSNGEDETTAMAILGHLKTLVGGTNKMISQSGQIIDVPVLE